MTKGLFIDTLHQLEKQYNYDVQYAENLQKALKLEEPVYYENHFIANQLIKILQVQMNDDNIPSLIEEFICDFNFGKNPNSQSDAESLYNTLISRNHEKTN
jgi:hypothetical protein